jgi:hypothetical protein
MRPKTTIILLVLLVICGLIVTLGKIGWFDKSKPSKPASRLVFAEVRPAGAPVKPQDVKTMIVNQQGNILTFQKVKGKWTVSDRRPHSFTTQQNLVENLVATIIGLKYTRAFDPTDKDNGLPDEITGLDKPQCFVSLLRNDTFTKDKKLPPDGIILSVGKKAPKLGGDRTETFVRPLGSRKTYVVAVDLAKLLSRGADEYRDKTILSLSRGEIVTVGVVGREGYLLEKIDDKWKITKPIVAAADWQAVSNLLGKLTHLTTERFIATQPDSLGSFGLDKPQLQVTIITRTEKDTSKTIGKDLTAAALPPASMIKTKTYSLLLGSRRGESICAKLVDRPEVFALPAKLLDDLQPPLADLRSEMVMDFDRSRLTRVDVETPDGEFTLQHDGQWKITAPRQGPADAANVDALLRKLAVLRAKKWITATTRDEESKLVATAGCVTLHLKGREKPLRLTIGQISEADRFAYCRRADSRQVAAVPVTNAKALLAPARHYWSKQLVQLPPTESINSITLDRPDGGFKLIRSEGWRLMAPVNTRTDDKQIQVVLRQLRSVRAEKIVALGKAVPAEYAKAKERITVKYSTTLPADTGVKIDQPVLPKGGTYQLIAVKTPAGCFAWNPQTKPIAIGQCSPQLFDSLAGELRDREVWRIDPAAIREIEITRAGKTYRLIRKGKNWVGGKTVLARIDPAKVDSFLKGIETLQAVKFLRHTTGVPERYGLDAPTLVITLHAGKEKRHTLRVSAAGPLDQPGRGPAGRYATSSQTGGVSLLSRPDVEKLDKPYTNFAEGADTPRPAQQGPMRAPGGIQIPRPIPQ